MAYCSRTLAIKAALGAGFLLILLNLLNSKLDSTTAPHSYSRLGITHWPKRTHASLEKHSIATTTSRLAAGNADGKGNTITPPPHLNANASIQIIEDLLKLSRNASKLPTQDGGAPARQNQSSTGNDTNLPHSSDDGLSGSPGVATGGGGEQKNVIQNFEYNPNNNRTSTSAGVTMVASSSSSKTDNHNSSNAIPANESSSRLSDSSSRTSSSNSSSAKQDNLRYESEAIGGLHEEAESSVTALPVVEQDALLNAPPRVNDIPEISGGSNQAEGRLRNFFDKFTINSCPPIPPNLDGPIKVDESYESLSAVEQRFADKLQPGGQYAPPDCTARNRVAIIVPYRDREQHLPIFLKNIHALLIKQQLEYGVYIVEQTAGTSFNRAELMNIGFVEAMKQKNWECMVFHDIDLLPMDDRNLYTCPDQPRHMSVAVDTFSFKLPYSTIFGGVSAMTEKQFRMVNGFSNSFWGWGGEDDDMSNRLKHVGFHIARYPVNIARYTMLNHKKEKANPKRYEKLVNGAKRYDSDGLNSLHYQLVNLIRKPLYTWIHAEISPDGS